MVTKPHGPQLISTFEGKGTRGCASSDKEKCARGGRVTQISCAGQRPQARCVLRADEESAVTSKKFLHT